MQEITGNLRSTSELNCACNVTNELTGPKMARWRRYICRGVLCLGVTHEEYYFGVDQLIFIFEFRWFTCHIVTSSACIYNRFTSMQDEP